MARPAPLESFHPGLKEAWKKAATARQTIKVPDRSAATRLRQRLYSLRSAMKAAGDPAYHSAQFASIRIGPVDQEDGPWQVHIEPADSEFEDALKSAGIEIDAVPDIDLEL